MATLVRFVWRGGALPSPSHFVLGRRGGADWLYLASRDLAPRMYVLVCTYNVSGVVRGSDAIHREERDGFHQVGPVEQYPAGHVPRRTVRVACGAAQGGSLAQLRAHQGKIKGSLDCRCGIGSVSSRVAVFCLCPAVASLAGLLRT